MNNKVEKIYKIVQKIFPVYTKEILILLAVFAMLLVFQTIKGETPEKVTKLDRPSHSQGDENITLFYDYMELENQQINFFIKNRNITDVERSDMLKAVDIIVIEQLMNQFDKYKSIDNKLKLISKMGECSISYRLYPNNIINNEGWIILENIGEQEDIIIDYTITLEDREKGILTCNNSVVIDIKREYITEDYSKKYSQYLLDVYQKKINADNQSSVLELPANYVFYSISNKNSFSEIVGTLITVILIFALISHTEHSLKLVNDNKSKKISLMYFINNFLLLYTTGMTIIRSFQYALNNRIESMTKDQLLYQQLVKLQQYSKEAISLKDILEQFVEIYDLAEGQRFSRLLLQNEKQGDDQLTNQLDYMTKMMWEKRIRSARKDSEKASSKLVFPMLLIFIVILMLTIVPTFMEMESIF